MEVRVTYTISVFLKKGDITIMRKTPRIPAFSLPTLLLSMTGCANKFPDNAAVWKSAMTDSVFSEDEEFHELAELTKDHSRVIWDESGERVLLLTWHNYDSDCTPSDPIGTEFGNIWVTSVGEVREWYAITHSSVKDWELRFAQLLELHDFLTLAFYETI